MFNKKKGRASGSDSENGGHSDRPWVYFMIDSFFLVTQFFVLTFQLRTKEDLIIPHKLTAPSKIVVITLDDTKPVAIEVSRETSETAPYYALNGGKKMDQKELDTTLKAMTDGHNPLSYSVKVSYIGNAIFGDVMPVFSTCAGLGIKKCGVQTARKAS